MLNRIETFESPGQLAEAGQFLLDNPFGPDAVAIDGFEVLMDHPWLEVAQGDPVGYAQNRELLYELVPEFTELDVVVADWDAQQVHPVNVEPGIGFVYLRTKGIGFHLDDSTRVAIGLSIRVDDSTKSREILVRRPEAIQTADGLIFKEVSNKTPHSQVTRILQKPGQAIMIMHHPRRTLHKVLTNDTQTLIVGYNGNRSQADAEPVIPRGNYSRPTIRV